MLNFNYCTPYRFLEFCLVCSKNTTTEEANSANLCLFLPNASTGLVCREPCEGQEDPCHATQRQGANQAAGWCHRRRRQAICSVVPMCAALLVSYVILFVVCVHGVHESTLFSDLIH